VVRLCLALRVGDLLMDRARVVPGEHTGHAVVDELLDAAAAQAGHRQAGRARLERGDPEGLQPGRREVEVRAVVPAGQLGLAQPSGQQQPRLHVQAGHQGADDREQRPLAGDLHLQRHLVRQPAPDQAGQPQQGQGALAAGEPHGAEHPHRRPGGHRAGRRPVRRVDPVVQHQHPAMLTDHLLQLGRGGRADRGRDRAGAHPGSPPGGIPDERADPAEHAVPGDHRGDLEALRHLDGVRGERGHDPQVGVHDVRTRDDSA
jgi:hypothetical protein